jgi:hypothetical protein
MNLAGTILLFYSFQATSSDFRLVTAPSPRWAGEKEYDLCVNGFNLAGTDTKQGMIWGGKCADWGNSRPAAVVNIEHPFFEGLGFTLLLLGFALQYFALPQPKTIASLRQELKAAKMQDKSDQSTKQ